MGKAFVLVIWWLILLMGESAAQYRTVASCPGGTLNIAGQQGIPTVDVNGTVCSSGSSGSQSAPLGATGTQTKLTVAVTNTYQQAFAPNATRKGCTIQYIGATNHVGFVFFGAAPADTTTSYQLQPGQTAYCSIGGTAVNTQAVQLTGTGTDIFVIQEQN